MPKLRAIARPGLSSRSWLVLRNPKSKGAASGTSRTRSEREHRTFQQWAVFNQWPKCGVQTGRLPPGPLLELENYRWNASISCLPFNMGRL